MLSLISVVNDFKMLNILNNHNLGSGSGNSNDAEYWSSNNNNTNSNNKLSISTADTLDASKLQWNNWNNNN
ncbi:hypothetical protein BLA29_006701 [Euroglyphus maynei]|uniref:Uncharacterized protein n=1 Tax=Euroglyphus maynei TaxID=6958 RepID=A0A1Y3BP85_EURMA|nr:hypothetical protein BLA29_006701 [Euroglyphus maynei]